MSDYAKASVKLVYSTNADYSDPEIDTYNWSDYEISAPTKCEERKVSAATGAGTTITTNGTYTTVSLVVVHNLDTTNYVTATYRSAGGGATDQNIRIAAGRYLVLCDFTAASNLVLVANGAACTCQVVVVGT